MSSPTEFEPGPSGAEQPEQGGSNVLRAGTEMMILLDGRILVHNLTPAMRALLREALGGETVAGVSLGADCAVETVPPMIRNI